MVSKYGTIRGAMMLVIIVWLAAAGCKGKEDKGPAEAPARSASPESREESKRAAEPKAAKSYPALTTVEAADLAYKKAVEWDKDAVLWDMNPVMGADYHWAENDRAWMWGFLFVRPQDDKRYNVRIEMGKITGAMEEKYTKRQTPIPAGCPAARPKVTLKEAGRALAAAGVKDFKRCIGGYTVESSYQKFRGRPIWSFLSACPPLLYDVDGLTGELLEIRDFQGNVVTLEQAKNMGPCEVKEEWKEEDFIHEFFEAIDRDELDKALSMMHENMAGNEQMRNMWKDNFKSLETIVVIRLVREPQKKWQNGQPLYRAAIYAKPKTNQYGWDEGENTRWITVTRADGELKIAEIATGP